MYEINRFFTINSLFFVQNFPEQSEILSTDSKNPRASDSYVQHNKILNLLIIFIITVAAGKILIFHFQRPKVREEVQSFENFQRKSCSLGFQAVFKYILRFFNPKLNNIYRVDINKENELAKMMLQLCRITCFLYGCISCSSLSIDISLDGIGALGRS